MKVNPIIRFAVDRKVTMTMAVVGVMVLGWLSLTRLPLEFLPSFSSSFISVDAPYPSSSPAETERLIVRPLEDILGTINGVETLTAVATSSGGNVSLRFADGTDMDLAAVDVRDRVDRVRHRLPADLLHVNIRRFQTSDRPVMRFQVSADWPRERLYRFTEDVIVRRLQRLEGVAEADIGGIEVREVQVNLIPDRLAALGIDVREVAAAVRRNHDAASVGTVREGSRAFFVRVDGKLRDLDQIRDLPLGKGLRLADVADVEMAYPEQEEWDFLNGQEALNVRLYKASTANLLAMIDGAKRELAAIQALPEATGLHLNIYRDDSEDVRNGIKELRNTGLLGGGLAVLFMYLFLRRLRSTLLVAVAIPVSVVVTFVFMYLSRQAGWTDLTLNIMSLMGLMLSIGMLVDNSIVVIESIFRHHEELGEDARTATLHGASEVALPIAASTLTTMCVFLPMVFLPTGGRFAVFMTNIGLTVVVVMAASLAVALTVVPMVAARLLGGERPHVGGAWARFAGAYGRSLGFMLRHRLAFAFAVVLALVGSWQLYQQIERSFQTPSFERQVTIVVDTPSSYSVEQKRALFDEVYAALDQRRSELEIADITHTFRSGSGRSRGWSHGNRLDIYLVDEEQAKLDTAAIRDRIEALLPVRAGVTFTMSRSQRGHMGSGSSIEVQLRGDRFEILELLAARAVAALQALPGIRDADSSLESGDVEVLVRPDRERTLAAGLSSRAVAQSVSSALSSRAATYFEVGDRELDLVIQHRQQDRQTLDQLAMLPVAFGDGRLAIGAVADFETAPGARSIERVDRQSSLTITADTATGTPSFVAQRMAEEAIAALGLPAGYEVVQGESWMGAEQDAEDSLFLLLFALVLIYMVMASLFESFAQPFTIMFSVPFAFIGVGVIMTLTGQARSSGSDMGLILLAGIVVNNAIVLVDHVNALRRQGLPREEAIIRGGRNRLRPILMTAITTVLGLLPMVAGYFLPSVFGAPDGRAAFWAPVGLVILGGLTTSTFLTVMVIPIVYSLVDDLTAFARRVAAEALRHRPVPVSVSVPVSDSGLSQEKDRQ
ncbi:MAG: efflux RND transporter permease subunit [Thermoanaerobaculales bacterium]|nr:efflux RND transporter permease subunit [Thermoanaerobaculales bacterium]